MAILKVYAYEYYEPETAKYVRSASYATIARLEGHNMSIVGKGLKLWFADMGDLLEVEETRLADGFFTPNTPPKR